MAFKYTQRAISDFNYHKTCKYVVEGEPEHKHGLLKEVIGSCLKIVLSLIQFVLCLIYQSLVILCGYDLFSVVEILERVQ